VLAAAVGVDRAVEVDVRRVVVGEQALRLLVTDLGRQRLAQGLAVGKQRVERVAIGAALD